MQITQTDKDNVLNLVKAAQRLDVFVRFDKLQEMTRFSKKKLSTVLNTLADEANIRIGGMRGSQWCVAEVPDKRQQVLDAFVACNHHRLELTKGLSNFTGGLRA